jgi:hypothetical protein
MSKAFLKIRALKLLAPIRTKRPFKLAQLVDLTLFIFLPMMAEVRFEGEPIQATAVA